MSSSLIVFFIISIIIIIVCYFSMNTIMQFYNDQFSIDNVGTTEILTNPRQKFIDEIESLNRLIDTSSDEIKRNVEKIEILESTKDSDIIKEINDKIKQINDIESNNKIVIDENQLKLDKLKELNKNLDIMIIAKQEKEEELEKTNKSMECIININEEKIDKLISLNEKMSDIIELSNDKIDKFMKRKNDIEHFTNISEELKSFNIDTTEITNLGANIINGIGKSINMDESTVFIKMDVGPGDNNYYAPLYKIQNLE